jgi:hypothetical protein
MGGTLVPVFAENYGVICLHNQVGQRIHFQYRWGDQAPWQQENLVDAQYVVLSWEYRNGNASPELQIRMDVDMTNNSDFRVYTLQRYKAWRKNCQEGKNYIMYQHGNRLYLRAKD